MTGKQALEILSRYAPCPHDNSDSNIGDGSTWLRCDDCGVVFDVNHFPAILDACKEFDEAVEKIKKLIS